MTSGPTCRHLLHPLISLPPLLHCPRLARRAPLLHPATIPAPWPLLHRRPYMLHGCCPSSIPSERRPPELDSATEDLAQSLERMPPLGRAGGGAKHLHQGPPPSTSSCSIGAGAGGELHRGLQSFVSPRPLLHPASVLGSSAGAAAGELHPWGLLPSRRQASRRLTTRSPSGPRPEAPATPRGAASKLSDPRATTGHCASHIRQPPPSYSYRTRSPHCTHEKMRNGDERRKKMLTGGARMSLRG
jgi:hypothetical protein